MGVPIIRDRTNANIQSGEARQATTAHKTEPLANNQTIKDRNQLQDRPGKFEENVAGFKELMNKNGSLNQNEKRQLGILGNAIADHLNNATAHYLNNPVNQASTTSTTGDDGWHPFALTSATAAQAMQNLGKIAQSLLESLLKNNEIKEELAKLSPKLAQSISEAITAGGQSEANGIRDQAYGEFASAAASGASIAGKFGLDRMADQEAKEPELQRDKLANIQDKLTSIKEGGATVGTGKDGLSDAQRVANERMTVATKRNTDADSRLESAEKEHAAAQDEHDRTLIDVRQSNEMDSDETDINDRKIKTVQDRLTVAKSRVESAQSEKAAAMEDVETAQARQTTANAQAKEKEDRLKPLHEAIKNGDFSKINLDDPEHLEVLSQIKSNPETYNKVSSDLKAQHKEVSERCLEIRNAYRERQARLDYLDRIASPSANAASKVAQANTAVDKSQADAGRTVGQMSMEGMNQIDQGKSSTNQQYQQEITEALNLVGRLQTSA